MATKRKEKMVRCTFELTESEAEVLCDIRCEHKVSTAAAQVVRLVLRHTPLAKIGEVR